MDKNEIINALHSLRFTDGKDCSEYASELQNRLGGTIVNFIADDSLEFTIDESSNPYLYHTVLVVDDLVIDYLNNDNKFWSADEYQIYLCKLNNKSIITSKNIPTNFSW